MNERIAVISSQIHAVGYNEDTRDLDVEFKASGDKPRPVYRYPGVDMGDFLDFVQSESIGKSFAKFKVNRDFKKIALVHPDGQEELLPDV